LLIALAIFLFGIWLGYSSSDSLSSAAKEEIRRQWSEEEAHRASIREAWALEVKTHSDLRTSMDREAILWKLQVVACAVTSSLVTIAMNGLDFFTNENFRKYELQKLKIDSERAQWALEREELERKRSLIAWGDVQASSACTRYQTKEYTATLYNVPFGVDPVEECYKRSIEINGHHEKSTLCEDRVSTSLNYTFRSRSLTR